MRHATPVAKALKSSQSPIHTSRPDSAVEELRFYYATWILPVITDSNHERHAVVLLVHVTCTAGAVRCRRSEAKPEAKRAVMSSPWTPFHQAEALTTRLANILDEYPPGVSTLREFVQNADDAGASKIVLCLDLGCNGTSNAAAGALPTSNLADFNGPSLLVYNDATFSERDFASITAIGKSRKRDDNTTIGKYGLGFNVVYHFTDLPQFVSGDTIVLFDPHGKHLPGDGELGMRAKFTDGLAERYPGLLDPLLAPLAQLHESAAKSGGAAAGSWQPQRDQPIDATLFRLPLRTEAQARTSELSSRAVSPSGGPTTPR